MKKISKRTFERTVKGLGILVEKAHPNSALSGLTTVITAFGALLDVYAMPNAENPEGMCDSKEDFRKYFAEILATGPTVQPSANLAGMEQP